MDNNLYSIYASNLNNSEKPISAVEIVINHIRSLILKRELRIGDKLPTESELCELLNVGRGSVREAVKHLEAIQLLDIRRGDGTYIADVREITAFDSLLYKIVLEDIDFEQILDYRIQLEISIMQLAIRNCTDDILNELQTNCDTFAEYINKNDDNTFLILHDLDIKFHQLLGKATKNLLLADVYEASLKLFFPYVLNNYQQGQARRSPKETIENHILLLNALKRKDMCAATHAVINSTKLWNTWISSFQEKSSE